MNANSIVSLANGAEQLARGSSAARAWVNELAGQARSVASEQQTLVELALKAENLARKLRASAARRNCVGVFGPSQAGKSYLVSVLARKPGGTLLADFAGDTRNFIADINPPGDRESTGLVTRFTIERGTRDTAHPVEVRLLTETDLVKIIGNSFFSDFDSNQRKVQPPEEEAVRAAIQQAEALAGEPQPHLDEIAMFDVGEYFRMYFPTGVERFNRARYWEALTRFGHRLPFEARVQFYAVLWGRIDDFTRLFVTLVQALDKLGHPADARTVIGALIPRESSIIDVETLSRLGKPDDDSIAVVPVATKVPLPIKLPRAVFTALIAEVKIVMTEQPWSFFDHTDLLDFPGARSREKQIDLPSDPVERDDRVRNLLLRGKIAYLFSRYTEERELTSILLCMPPSNLEVKDLPGMVNGWVEQTHGDSPEKRRKVPCGLFLVLTKFDMDFIEKSGDTKESRATKFDRRLDASFLKPYGADQWVQDWDGAPFGNTAFLRNPGMKQPHIIKYRAIRTAPDGSEQLDEEGPNPEFADKLAEYQRAFESSDVCRKHFQQPAKAWEAAFTPNDGGVSYLVARLEEVLSPQLKARQITGRLVDQAKSLHGRLSSFYRAEDDSSRKQHEEALLNLRRRLVAAVDPRKSNNFVALLSCLMLEPLDAREALLNVAAMREEAIAAPESTPDAQTAEDDFDDLFSQPAEAIAASPAKPTARQRDRSDVFALHVFSLWSKQVYGLVERGPVLATLKIDTRLAAELVEQLMVGAHRKDLVSRIATKVRSQIQAANVRWDEVADRAGEIAAMTINDYVAYLGFAELAPSNRPGVPEPPGTRRQGVFEPLDLPVGMPALGDRRRPLEIEFFRDWAISLRQLGVDNQGFAGGREIDPEQNARLGKILADVQVAAELPLP